jgi:hypothetical protein
MCIHYLAIAFVDSLKCRHLLSYEIVKAGDIYARPALVMV